MCSRPHRSSAPQTTSHGFAAALVSLILFFTAGASGQIVGTATANSHSRPVLWQNGNTLDIGGLGGSIGQAYGINDSGQVTGFSYTTNNLAYHGFLWQNGNMIDLGALGSPDRDSF